MKLATIVAAVALLAAVAPAAADAAYDRCIDESDGTNEAWGACGSDWIAREDGRLNATWKRVFGAAEGQTKTDLLAEQRAWNTFKEAACAFYANGDWGREGAVLGFPACRAGVIAERTSALEAYGEYLAGE